MTGTNKTPESAEIKLVSLDISEVFTHKDYIEKVIGPKEAGHDMPVFFHSENLNPRLDKITVSIKVCMRDLRKGIRIAGFTIKSVHYVNSNLSIKMKEVVLAQILNQLVCNITGAWTVQFRNKSICNTFPQGYNKFLEDELMLKKTVAEWK